MKKFWNVLGQIFGFLTIALFAFLYTDSQFNFGLPVMVMDIMVQVKEYAALGVAAIVGMEFVSGKKLFVFIYLLILAIVVIFMFFPTLVPDIVSFINGMIS
jgi:hypothetical protein